MTTSTKPLDRLGRRPAYRQNRSRSEFKNPLILYSTFVGVSLMLLGAVTAASLMV